MINEKINFIIEDLSPVGGEPKPESKLKDELGIDSLRLVELIVAIEEEFSIEFALSDFNTKNFSVVSDVYDLVGKYVC